MSSLPQAKVTLLVEALEERTVPSGFLGTGLIGSLAGAAEPLPVAPLVKEVAVVVTHGEKDLVQVLQGPTPSQSSDNPPGPVEVLTGTTNSLLSNPIPTVEAVALPLAGGTNLGGSNLIPGVVNTLGSNETTAAFPVSFPASTAPSGPIASGSMLPAFPVFPGNSPGYSAPVSNIFPGAVVGLALPDNEFDSFSQKVAELRKGVAGEDYGADFVAWEDIDQFSKAEAQVDEGSDPASVPGMAPQEADLVAQAMPGNNLDALTQGIQQFLQQVDDLGRDLGQALAQNPWLGWGVGTGLAAAAALEVARRQVTRRKSQPTGEGDLNWVPGLPGSFQFDEG